MLMSTMSEDPTVSADADHLLSLDELAVLSQGMDDGTIEVDTGYNLDADVVAHDLAKEDSSLGINVSTLDMINERFIRLFRLGLLETLRSTTRINPERVRISSFGEYAKTLAPPLSVNVVRMAPLRGHVLVAIEQSVVFSSLDNFFGGVIQEGATLQPSRFKRGKNEAFTPTESRIISLILQVLFSAMKEAWSPVLDVDFEHVSSEINPQFAQIADEDDLVIVNRFDTDPNDQSKGFIDLVYPYTALKPIRELLRGRVQTGDGDEASDKQWQMELEAAVGDSSVELRVLLGEIHTTLRKLEQVREGDILFFNKPDLARVMVNGIACFDALVGTCGPNVAARIEKALSPPDPETENK